ncbi:MAG: MFS transporter [Candidatus Bathyarchaeota archaeon]|nr:MAG: MFS transporter [Candidatus Bathyarchaeota archaeon]
MDFEQVLVILIFTSTTVTYLLFLVLGRKWRKDFEQKGIRYWTAPKEQRIKELMNDVWRPKLITVFYGLAYFTNGYMKIAYSMWAPLFLLQVRGIDVLQVALFLGLVYTPWQWKMFLGLASDGLPLKFRGKTYRRHHWFLLAGLLSVLSSVGFLFINPHEIPIWTGFFPMVFLIVTAGAIFDMVADAYALDVTPPEFHARVLGGVNTVGMALGGATAALLPPVLLQIGGYQLVFFTSGLTGLFAFLFLFLKEPPLVYERALSKQAIAFTFTEKTVLIASLLMLSQSMGTARLGNPTGGMFTLIMNEIVGNFTPEQAGTVALVVLLAGIPSSLIGGWAADRFGHKRVYFITGVAFAVAGFLWISLRPGMVMWFIFLAMLTNFLQRLNAGGRMALMGDSTPLALSGTVFQMYMSFSWIGNVPASIIIGLLLPVNVPLLMGTLAIFTFIPLLLARFLTPYEVGKATSI